MRYGYGFEWVPGGVFLGGVLLILIVPSFALIALAVVALAAVAALVALAGAIIASPYLVVRTVRRRLAERHAGQPQPLPAAKPVAAESVVAT
jgi:positive regulator of sigma E activity